MLHTRNNPGFFNGTVVEQAIGDELSLERASPAAKLRHLPGRAIVTTKVFGTGIMFGFGYLLFDSSPIFIAKGAPSSNEMSPNLFQGHDLELAPHAFLELFKLEFGNVLVFQAAASPRDSLREFQSALCRLHPRSWSDKFSVRKTVGLNFRSVAPGGRAGRKWQPSA